VKQVAVLGGGSWGTTLAQILAKKGIQVTLWTYEPEVAEAINRKRENPLFLPGIKLERTLKATPDLGEALKNREGVLLVVPSHAYRRVAKAMVPFLSPGMPIISASKGIENHTYLTMTGVLRSVLPASLNLRLACLTGPSFAREVVREIPTAAILASEEESLAQKLQRLFSTPYFRIYSSRDLIGAEIGGSIKNIMALAAGISDGLGFGTNTRAALVTRGLAEIARLGQALGAKPHTFFGLSGLGDLVLTCTGDLSRNRQVGLQLGRGEKLKAILSGMNMVAEGVETTRSVYPWSKTLGVEMPITREVYRILFRGKSPRQGVVDLMGRALKREHES
jgi:glycerol-3-phosphate dehydrogenase (NAD(P)+)